MRFLVIAVFLLLFVLSPNLLTILGWRYSGSNAGSFFEKLHPLLIVMLPIAMVAIYRKSITVFLSWLKVSLRYWLYLAFVIALTVLLFVNSVFTLAQTAGEFGQVAVTLLMPALLIACLSLLRPTDFRNLALYVRAALVVCSLIAIYEQISGSHVLPILRDGQLDSYGWRAVGIFGHPLTSATLTGLMVVFLVVSESGQFIRRLPELALHAVAMFAYGGRSAMVMVAAIVVLKIVAVLIKFAVTGRSQGLGRFVTIGALAALGAVAALPLAFVQASLLRFTDDSGSAETRLNALKILQGLSPSALMFGVPADQRDVLYYQYGAHTGIESAWGQWTLMYGALVAGVLAVLLMWLLYGVCKKLESAAIYMLVFFFAVVSSSISIGSKSLLVSYFIAMVMTLCWRERSTERRPTRSSRSSRSASSDRRASA